MPVIRSTSPAPYSGTGICVTPLSTRRKKAPSEEDPESRLFAAGNHDRSGSEVLLFVDSQLLSWVKSIPMDGGSWTQ